MLALGFSHCTDWHPLVEHLNLKGFDLYHLVACITSEQIPQEEVQKVFDRNPKLKNYYKQVRGLGKKERNMTHHTEYGYRGLEEIKRLEKELEELKSIIVRLKTQLQLKTDENSSSK